jgi:hypothetical protein
MCVQWPRSKKPKIGEGVLWDGSNGLIWRNQNVAIDVRRLKVDQNGDVYFC